jgi:hypothetical protein
LLLGIFSKFITSKTSRSLCVNFGFFLFQFIVTLLYIEVMRILSFNNFRLCFFCAGFGFIKLISSKWLLLCVDSWPLDLKYYRCWLFNKLLEIVENFEILNYPIWNEEFVVEEGESVEKCRFCALIEMKRLRDDGFTSSSSQLKRPMMSSSRGEREP